jgi:tripartite motif-containing protein 71
VLDGQLEWPVSVVVDSAGNVYVSDLALFYPRTSMIQKFDASGAFVKSWGNSGTGDGQFTYPLGMAIDKYAHVYVANFVNRRVQKFDSGGMFMGKWGGVGVDNGTFGWPFGVAVSSAGKVLVSDVTNNIVELFTPVP